MNDDYIFRKLDHHHTNLKKVNWFYSELRTLIEDGEIDFTIRRYKDYSDNLLSRSRTEYWHENRRNETEKHELLKAYGATAIQQSGREPEFEENVWFGVADVASRDRRIIFECGKVDIGKIFKALGLSAQPQYIGEPNRRYDIAEKFCVMPYSMNDDLPPARAIEFVRISK